METSGKVLLFHRYYPHTLICVHSIYCFLNSIYISNNFDVSLTDMIPLSLTKKRRVLNAANSSFITSRAVSLVWYTYLWCKLKSNTEYLINQKDCGNALFCHITSNFHPLIVGLHFGQLCTFRNRNEVIGFERDTEWYLRLIAEDGQDIFTEAVIGKSIQGRVLTQREAFPLFL